MAGAPPYLAASDGLPARVSGDWAREKLYYVDRYFDIFNKGMHKKWPHRAYVDLMAGPGRCINSNGTEEFDGSPVLAAKSDPPFERCVFVESDKPLRTALATRIAPIAPNRMLVIGGDCNDSQITTQIRSAIAVQALGIAFVDMLGLDVWLSTLQRLTTGRKIDLLITLQVNDFTRNAESALKEEHDPDRFDRFFGSPDWRVIMKESREKRRPATDLARALADYYVERLGTIGYQHVHQLHVLMRNTRKAPLYRLVLAAKHETAVDFFKKIAKIEYSGQRGFF